MTAGCAVDQTGMTSSSQITIRMSTVGARRSDPGLLVRLGLPVAAAADAAGRVG